MDGYVIAAHEHDPLLDSYRLTIGVERQEERPKVDENGNPVFEMVPLTAEGSDEPLVDKDGEPVKVPGDPVVETVPVVVPLEDFVFSAQDPKWKGKSKDEVAKEQRRLVRAALRARERAAGADARKLDSLPGVGDPL